MLFLFHWICLLNNKIALFLDNSIFSISPTYYHLVHQNPQKKQIFPNRINLQFSGLWQISSRRLNHALPFAIPTKACLHFLTFFLLQSVIHIAYVQVVHKRLSLPIPFQSQFNELKEFSMKNCFIIFFSICTTYVTKLLIIVLSLLIRDGIFDGLLAKLVKLSCLCW